MTEYIAKCTEVIGVSGNPFKFPEYIDLNSEIVRCRDCKRWESGDCDWNPYYDDPVDDQPDGFCAWACRKEQQWKTDAQPGQLRGEGE